jgi:FkbM family methyltransferase
MKLYQNTMHGLRHEGWSRAEAIAYFIKGAARELHIMPSFFRLLYEAKVAQREEQRNLEYNRQRIIDFKNKWLKQTEQGFCFDFGICKLPDVSNTPECMNVLPNVFDDVLMFPLFLNDNYDKYIVELLDKYLRKKPYLYEGPYGYTDNSFDVTVKRDDIVIDAGAWIGDFSAYAASKAAIVYAFEPTKETFEWLQKTKALNNNIGGQIYPVPKGLGDREYEVTIHIDKNNSGANSITKETNPDGEKASITTLDKFVEENKLERVDFIKADIEGAERDMLRGASNVLKTFAPKLAICTYHLPDDPEVLEKIIKDANPDYTVVHLRHKLFAAVETK